MERILRKELVNYLETHGLINDNQHGFRQNHNCTTQLLSQLHYILSHSVQGSEIDSIYIDYAKAFDKVDHGLLLKKLKYYGILGNYYNYIENFFKDRKQTVYSNNCFSYSTSVVSGVPQGSVLGPLLFVLYINDLSEIIDSSNSVILTFADDTKLISKISSVSEKNKLQDNLNNVIEWSKLNNMELNNDKFELICYSLGTNSNRKSLKELPFQKGLTQYYALEKSIEPVLTVRDLGVYIDNYINWTDHYNIIYKKAKQMCGWILSSFYSRGKDVMLVLFNSLVRSRLEYCCEVWFPHLKKDILYLEQIQRSFTNRIYQQQDLNYWQRLKNLKIYSLQRRREKIIILHVWKIKNNIYPNTVFLSFKLNKRTNAEKANLPPMPNVRGELLTQFEESFLVQACKLWNVLPPKLTHIKSLYLFKSELDKFLQGVPDEPPLPGYPAHNENSLLEQCLRLPLKPDIYLT